MGRHILFCVNEWMYVYINIYMGCRPFLSFSFVHFFLFCDDDRGVFWFSHILCEYCGGMASDLMRMGDGYCMSYLFFFNGHFEGVYVVEKAALKGVRKAHPIEE